MSASTKRVGEIPSCGGVSVAMRIAEIAAWLTRMVPAPRSSAAAIASATTRKTTSVPVPSARTMTSPTAMPTATPSVSSTARSVRRPRASPSEMTAEIGAKNGLSLTSEASAHAIAAASAVWAIPNHDARTRSRRRRNALRTSGSVGRNCWRSATGTTLPLPSLVDVLAPARRRDCATSRSSPTSTTARRRSSTPCSGSPAPSAPTRTSTSASWTRWTSSARRASRSSPRTRPSATAT